MTGHLVNFLIDTMLKLTSLSAKYLTLGGDCNCLMNPLVDRLPVCSLSVSKQTKKLLILELRLKTVEIGYSKKKEKENLHYPN